jgi:hypothetical protein
MKKKRCAACGFGETKKLRSFKWLARNVRRERKQQTGIRRTKPHARKGKFAKAQ